MQWLRLALLNIWRNGRRSLLLAFTLCIGNLALLLFVGYIAATLTGLRESTIRAGLGHIQIGLQGQFDGYADQPLQYGLTRDDQVRLEASLESDAAVRRVVPRLVFSGLVSNGPRTLNFQGQGIHPGRERQAFGAFQTLSAGVPLQAHDRNVYRALLGREMARRLGVQPGDSVTVMSSTVSGAINAIDVEVAGLIATGIPETELYSLQLPIEAAQELLRTDKLSYFAVLLNDSALSEATQARIGLRLGHRYELKGWQQLAPLYTQVLQLYRNQFVVFGSVIALLVFLSVSTMTLTTLFERAREIGTLRAMGISSQTIRRLFVHEGWLLGLASSLIGAGLAAIATVVINLLQIELPPPPGRNSGVILHLLWMPEYVLPISLTLPLVAMLAAWWTSRRLGRLPIVSALAPA